MLYRSDRDHPLTTPRKCQLQKKCRKSVRNPPAGNWGGGVIERPESSEEARQFRPFASGASSLTSMAKLAISPKHV